MRVLRRPRYTVLYSAAGYGITLWHDHGISLVRRGQVWIQLVVGDRWMPVPDERRPGDWSCSFGPLHIVRGDWWLGA